MHGIRYKNSSFLLGTLQTKAEYNPNFVDYQTYMTYKINDKVELSFLGNFLKNIQFRSETETQHLVLWYVANLKFIFPVRSKIYLEQF